MGIFHLGSRTQPPFSCSSPGNGRRPGLTGAAVYWGGGSDEADRRHTLRLGFTNQCMSYFWRIRPCCRRQSYLSCLSKAERMLWLPRKFCPPQWWWSCCVSSPSARETKLHQGEEQVILRRTRTVGQVPWRFTWELLRIRKDGNLSACWSVCTHGKMSKHLCVFLTSLGWGRYRLRALVFVLNCFMVSSFLGLTTGGRGVCIWGGLEGCGLQQRGGGSK